jgi:hypothetical protein
LASCRLKFNHQCIHQEGEEEVVSEISEEVEAVAVVQFQEIVKFSERQLKSLVDPTKELLELSKMQLKVQLVLSFTHRVKQFLSIVITLLLLERQQRTEASHHSVHQIARLAMVLQLHNILAVRLHCTAHKRLNMTWAIELLTVA